MGFGGSTVNVDPPKAETAPDCCVRAPNADGATNVDDVASWYEGGLPKGAAEVDAAPNAGGGTVGEALKEDWPNTGRLAALEAVFRPNAEGWPAKAENPPVDPLVLPVVAPVPPNAD